MTAVSAKSGVEAYWQEFTQMRKSLNSLDAWMQSIQLQGTRQQALRTALNKTFKLDLDRAPIDRFDS